MTKTNRKAATALWLIVALGALGEPASAQGALQGLPHKAMPENNPTLGAHARYSKAPINMSSPNLPLTVEIVAAGGGMPAFDTNRLVANLTGNGTLTQTELAALTKRFGADNVTSFLKTSNFVIADALATIAKNGTTLAPGSAAAARDGRALFQSLYAAGLMPNGKFDTEYMLDTLVSHIVHVQVMNDVDAAADFGPTADANYHLVLFQVMEDLEKAYGSEAIVPSTSENSGARPSLDKTAQRNE